MSDNIKRMLGPAITLLLALLAAGISYGMAKAELVQAKTSVIELQKEIKNTERDIVDIKVSNATILEKVANIEKALERIETEVKK